jgi:hypothetical protein
VVELNSDNRNVVFLPWILNPAGAAVSVAETISPGWLGRKNAIPVMPKGTAHSPGNSLKPAVRAIILKISVPHS